MYSIPSVSLLLFYKHKTIPPFQPQNGRINHAILPSKEASKEEVLE